jgi:hypothetical protein
LSREESQYANAAELNREQGRNATDLRVESTPGNKNRKAKVCQ